jgi:hypothetical protein
MNDETSFPAIEERLQAEARRLLPAEHGVSASQLRAIHRRRERSRRTAQMAGAVAVLLLVALAVRFGGRREETARAPVAPQQAIVAQIEQGKTTRGQAAPKRPNSLGGVAPADPLEKGVFAIPFVIGDPAAGEDIVTGFYVPEQVEPLDLRSLSPAERDAVRAVLGIEGEDTDVIQPI